ncbi:patched domain-containing protein 3-like isoform X2 [Convolutriloba macropyga]|uniref:patched domain-containing protein 3-like isoform X2 n=1 Tax=Convolutriloba macropyga TaxID=536237 RepID=UPI003F528848
MSDTEHDSGPQPDPNPPPPPSQPQSNGNTASSPPPYSSNGSTNGAVVVDNKRSPQHKAHHRSNGNSPDPEKGRGGHPCGGDDNEDEDVDDSCNACNCSCLEKCSNFITTRIENVFYKIGMFVGKRPWAGILIGLAVFLLPLPGYAFFYEETEAAKLWVPQDSRAITDRDNSQVWFPSLLRVSQALLVTGNVMTADVMQSASTLDTRIKALQVSVNTSGDSTYSTICYKAGPFCLENSFLEVWNWDSTTINALTDAGVLSEVNADPPVSGQTNQNLTVSSLFGDLAGEGPASYTGAKAMIMTYYLATKDLEDSEDYVLDWEEKFLDECEKGVSGVTVFRFSQRSPTDIGSGAVEDDIPFLFAGYALVIIFLFATLGKFNCHEQKVYLGLVGIICVAFSISISFSSASLFQQDYGPIHSVLPFLLLGIGVDDMFVFVAAWDNLTPEEKTKALPEKVALMTKHAGVSILITSLTDFAAFLIGATTIIPALRSFCIFAAMGILGIFLLTLFLFAGVLVYDQRRVAANRNACCFCCMKLGEDYKPNNCSQSSIAEKVFEHYIAKYLTWLPVKIVVVLMTAGFLGAGIAGVAKIEQDFDPNWFIPEGNYLYDYLQESETLFPNDGDDAYVFFGAIDYYTNYDALLTLPGLLTQVEGVAGTSIDFYLHSFDSWTSTFPSSGDSDIYDRLTNGKANNESNFVYLLNYYVTNVAQAYQSEVNFNSDDTAIQSSRMYFMFSKMKNSAARIDAMDGAREKVDSLKLGDETAFVYSDAFLVWEGDKVIYLELFRNIGMAFIVVFLVCMLLIANIAMVLLVLSCVVFTLVDVIGLIHFWGVTINTVSTINLILAIGLAVDYAAHIGHAFMANAGSRKKRVRVALAEIGPAVMSGGFSTFLAFFPLCASTSFVFETFFRIFFLVCVLGLFHGLIYLPVMMSWLGPTPYATAHSDNKHGGGGGGHGGDTGRGAVAQSPQNEVEMGRMFGSDSSSKKSFLWQHHSAANGTRKASATGGGVRGRSSRPASPGQVVPECQIVPPSSNTANISGLPPEPASPEYFISNSQ